MQKINKKNCRIWSRLGQRGTVCGVALPEIMEEKSNCYVLTADLAQLSGLERVKQKFSERFVNVGIAEQNMVGIGAGLAFEGNVVFMTTYATFLSMRCYEQIRHNLGYQNANVKLIGSSAGMAMGMSGNTHYSMEDMAIMRAIPNMRVISPADAAAAYYAVHYAAQHDGPFYIRLSGNLNEPVIYQEEAGFQFNKASIVREGRRIVLIAVGSMVSEAIKASELLEACGLFPTVIDMHTIKPLDTNILDKYILEDYIFTIEEHSIIGGLGSAVAEYLSEKKERPIQVRIGINDKFVHPGEYAYIKRENRLDAAGISQYIQTYIQKRM